VAATFALTSGGSAQTITTVGNITALSITNTIIRWNGASAGSLCGIAGGAEGRIVIVENVTAGQTLTLKHQSTTDATTGNRLITPDAADVAVAPGEIAALVYDNSTTRWRVLGPDSTYAVAAATIGTAAAGTAGTKPSRGDHVHGAGGGTPVTQAYSDVAAAGSGPAAAFFDHKHGMPASGGASYATPALTLGTSNAAGAAGTGIRSDASVAVFDATAPVTQAYADAAATGSQAFAARRDHKHGMPAAETAGSVALSGTPDTSTATGAITALAVTNATWRWNAASGATLHGIAGGTEGRIVVIKNVTTAQTLVIANQSATETTAGNRIINPSAANINLAPGESILASYDNSTARWYTIGFDSTYAGVPAYGSALGTTGTAGAKPSRGDHAHPVQRGPDVQVFTSGSGNWTKPVTSYIPSYVVIECVGGGGSAGGCAATAAGARAVATGGGGGGYARKTIAASSLGATEPYAVGAGGSAPAAGGNNGNAGGDSTFGAASPSWGTQVKGSGGTGGNAGASSTAGLTNAGVAGGAASGGDINVPGGDTADGRINGGPVVAQTSNGGTSVLGGGARAIDAAVGTAGKAYGGGGGGGSLGQSASAIAGAAGAAGVIIVTTYF